MRLPGTVRATGTKPSTRISLIVTILIFRQATESIRVNSWNSRLISAFRFLNFSFCLVTAPSLADWEKDWQENPQRSVRQTLLQVNFRSPLVVIAQSNWPLVENYLRWRAQMRHEWLYQRRLMV
jgi:hypothetical protein